MADRKVNWGEIWGTGLLAGNIWGTFDLVVFEVIFGSFGGLGRFFSEKGIFKRLLLLQSDSFSTKHFLHVPCDSPHKNYLQNLEISIYVKNVEM